MNLFYELLDPKQLVNIEQAQQLIYNIIETVAFWERKRKEIFLEKQNEIVSLFKILVFSQKGLFEYETSYIHQRFEQFLNKLEKYNPELCIDEMREVLSNHFQGYLKVSQDEINQLKTELDSKLDHFSLL